MPEKVPGTETVAAPGAETEGGTVEDEGTGSESGEKLGMAAGCPIESASHYEWPQTEKARRFGSLKLAADVTLTKPGC